MPYDHSAFLGPREVTHRGIAGTAVPNGVDVSFYTRSLRKLVATVQVAATTAVFAVAVRQGTTAIATLTLGTAAALGTVSSDITDTEIAAGTPLNFLHVGQADAIADVTYEYRYTPDNTLLTA